MALPHFSAWKLVVWTPGFLAAVWTYLKLWSLDPTLKGAIVAAIVGGIIAAIPPTITGLFGLRKQDKTHAVVEKIEVNTNSTLSEIRQEKQKASLQAQEATSRADIAVGSEAGRQLARSEAAEDKAKEK